MTDARQAAAERAEELRDLLRYHSYRYHVKDSPVITDQEYDELFNELKALEAAHPELATDDSPTRRVGAEPRGDLPKVRHAAPVLSLANAFSPDDLAAWRARIGRLMAEGAEVQYVVEPKLDGLSVVLTYENGLFVQGATRGNGVIGEDVTPNLRTVRALPLRIPTHAEGPPAPPLLVVRGEVFFRLPVFEGVNKRRVEQGETPFVNPRNAAAGALRQLDPGVTASRPLDLAVYQILSGVGDDLPTTQWDVLAYLAALGFPVMVDSSARFETLEEVEAHIEVWDDRRHDLDFEIDGLVVKVDDLAVSEELGVVGKDPRAMIAFKYPAEERTTKLLDVGVNVGRTGMLIPFAVLEPVELSGATVRLATLHNFDDIAAKDIRRGDTVVVKRSGEVIPYVVGPVADLRDGSEEPIAPPAACPFCGAPVERSDGEVAHYCSNPECPERLVRMLGYFVSRGAMDVDGLGDRIVRQLISQGLLHDVADLYFLQKDDLVPLEGFGEKKAENILAAIDASRRRPLARVLTALGIRGVGSTVSQLVLDHIPTIEGIAEASQETLEAIPGLGPHTASAIVEFFADDRNRALIEKLRAGGVDLTPEVREQVSGALEGLTFVLTGTLPTLTRGDATELIESHGGRVTGSVSSKTDYVLAGESAGSKLDKANKLGVPVIDEDTLREMLGA